jgi:hypothetical protein
MFFSSITEKTFTGVNCIYEQHGGCLIRSKNCLPFASTWVHLHCFFDWVLVAHHSRLLCCPIMCLYVLCSVLCVFTFCVPCYVSLRSVSRVMCLYVLCSVLWSQLRLHYKNYVRFVFISSCLYDGSCLIYVMCVWLRIVVSNTYCVVFLLCFSSSCVPNVASLSRLSLFDFPFVYLK